MTVKKSKMKQSTSVKTKTKPKTKSKKQIKTRSKSKVDDFSADAGIVIIDDDLTIDKKIANEERRAYLEESRSQEVSD